MVRINFKKIDDRAKMPKRGSAEAAGYDLYAATSDVVTILPHKTVLIDTGIAVEIPEGYFGGIYARSGLALKKSLAPINEPGVIDSDYRNSIKVALHNHSDFAQVVDAGDRIAQLIIQPYEEVMFAEVTELSDTVRGQGGFGSTGTN